MKNRNAIPDLLKGVAVLCMIQVHVLEVFAIPTLAQTSCGKFLLFLGGPLVAPVFGAVFGYFIAASHKTTKQLYMRAVYLVLLGLGLNILLNANLYYKIYNDHLQVDPYPYIFGVDFLLFAGLALFPLSLLKNSKKNKIVGLLIALIIASFSGALLLEYTTTDSITTYVLAFLYGTAHWSYFPLLPWICYPLMGMLYHNLQVKQVSRILQKPKTQTLVVVLGGVFLYFTLYNAIETASDLQNYYHHGMQFVIWTGLFLILITTIASKIEVTLSNTFLVKKLKWLGKNVTAIYIGQWIIIGNIGTEIFHTIDSPLLLVASYIGILTSCILLVLGWEKINH
jgi:uncharacterized membrane protein